MRTHKKGKCSLVYWGVVEGSGWGEGGGIIHANERTVVLKSSFVNLSTPTFPPQKGKKFFISSYCRGLMFKELPW